MELEKRQITVTLPTTVWEILDGANVMATSAGSQTLENWISHNIAEAVLTCVKTVCAVQNDDSVSGRA